MKMNKFIMAVLLLLTVVSCNTLKSRHYVGERISNEELLKTFHEDSTWEFHESAIHVKIAKDEIFASSVKWNPQKKLHEVETKTVIFSNIEDANFINIKDGELYNILQIGFASKNEFILYRVDEKKIKKDMKNKVIKGVSKGSFLKEDNYILDVTKNELDEYIRKNVSTLFCRDMVGILRCLKQEKKK